MDNPNTNAPLRSTFHVRGRQYTIVLQKAGPGDYCAYIYTAGKRVGKTADVSDSAEAVALAQTLAARHSRAA